MTPEVCDKTGLLQLRMEVERLTNRVEYLEGSEQSLRRILINVSKVLETLIEQTMKGEDNESRS